MTTPIDPDDIKVGDTVRSIVTRTYVVTSISDVSINGAGGISAYKRNSTVEDTNNQVTRSWELVSRPDIHEQAEVGSLWWHPRTKTGWVRCDNADYPGVVFRQFSGRAAFGKVLAAEAWIGDKDQTPELIPWADREEDAS